MAVRYIPIPLVVILSLGTVGGVWWSETREMDFMTPRGVEVPLADFAPGMATPDAPGPRAVVPVNLGANNAPLAGTSPPASITLHLGDLASAPGLSEYSEHARKGAAYLIALATELETRGEFERALLCWERVLDSAQPDALERETAAGAVARIKPTLPRWNVDPVAEVTLIVQIGSTRAESAAMAGAVLELEDFLRRDSGDQINFVSQVTFAPADRAQEDGPIAISISGEFPDPDALPLVRSTTPSDPSPTALYIALLAECYLLVENHLGTLPEVVAPPLPRHPENPDEDFSRQVTRLHWKVFAQSLLTDPPAPEES